MLAYTSNKYFAWVWRGLRRHLASQRIETLIDLGRPVASIAYPSIIVVRKASPRGRCAP